IASGGEQSSGCRKKYYVSFHHDAGCRMTKTRLRGLLLERHKALKIFRPHWGEKHSKLFLSRCGMETIQKRAGEDISDEMRRVQAAKKGDLEAFSELVNRYDRNVFRIAQHITHNEEDAQDVVQDAFLKAYQNLEQFQGNSKFYTWLVRIAVNEALMKLRKR